MAEEEDTGRAVPPYVSYRTLRTFVDSLKQGIPGRIDRSVMSTMSGATQAQLLSALRSLNLINEQGVPQDSLSRLVHSEGSERGTILKAILHVAYPSLFSKQNGFDLETATAKMFDEQFRAMGVTGGTVRKCQLFFLAAAKDAGLSVSPYIEKPAKQSTDTRPARRSKPATPSRERSSAPSAQAQTVEARPLTWQQMLLSKFPSLDPEWSDEVKEKWFDSFKELMQMGGETQ